MTCRLTRSYAFGVVVPFFAILVLFSAAAVWAQLADVVQASGKASDVFAPGWTSAPVQAERPSIPSTDTAERVPVIRSRAKRHGARPMDANPLFLPVVMDSIPGADFIDNVVVTDVNGDGKPDLVVGAVAIDGEPNGLVVVLLGNGDGSFRAPVNYSTGGDGATTVAVADVNGDGRLDVVAVNTVPGIVTVLLGNGDGTFQPALTCSGGTETLDLAIADVNQDGKPDLIVANADPGSGTVGVLLGNGDGTFQPVVAYSAGEGSSSVAVGDVNGDVHPDVLVADYSGNTVAVLLGNGDGTFQPAVTYSSGGLNPASLVVADVNGDKKLDVLVANSCRDCDGSVDGSVGVLLGNGDGTFQPVVTYDSGGWGTYSLAAADVNGDGTLDLVTANAYTLNVGVLLGNGNGTFQAPLPYDPGGWLQTVTAADVNGDGRPDIIVTNWCSPSPDCGLPNVGVLLNNTGPHSSTTTDLASSLTPSIYGQAVTFAATVISASGTPTGTVIFFDTSTAIGSAALVNGSTSLSTPSLASGAHSITAAYQPSLHFSGSTSVPVGQTVNMATTTASLVSSADPAAIRQSVTYTATVTSQYGGALTGTVAFQDGGKTIATVTLSGSQAAFSTSYKSAGAHLITARYSGDANNVSSMSAVLEEAIGKPTFRLEITLATSGSPSLVGQSVTFTATVTSIFGAIPDGELVTFYDGRTAIGSGTTAGGVATFTTSSLTATTHAIKAIYAGDAIFLPNSRTVKQVVDKFTTTTALSSSLNPSNYGQGVTFTATVTQTGPSIPTGRVVFKDGTLSIGSATLSVGVATLTRTNLAVGSHSITAKYIGDAVSAVSVSSVLDQVIQ
jgi:hypothetical protein